MRQKIIILLCFALGSLSLSAQQDAQFTLFPWASLYYNPGMAGEQSNTLCFTGIFTNRYTSLKDNQYLSEIASQTGTTGTGADASSDYEDYLGARDFLINAEFYSRKIRGAIGLSIVGDNIFPFSNVTVRLGYTYRMRIAGGSLGIGFQASLFNQKLDPNKWRYIQDNDPVITKIQELGGTEGPSYMDMDFSLGLHYRAETWDVGLSAVNLLGNSSITLSGGEELKLARQIYLHGGYIWTLPWNPNWTIEPKALIKTDFASYQIDAMILTRYNGVIWGGVGYRINDMASLLIGARPFYNSSNIYLKGLDVGFAYSFTTTKFAYQSRGSFGDFEVMIRYCFDIYKTETFSGYGSSRSIYKNQY